MSSTLQRLAVGQSPVPEEGLAQQLVDDCLYILDCPSQTPDLASLKHRAHDRRLIQRVFDLVMASPQEHFNVLQLANGAGCLFVSCNNASRLLSVYHPANGSGYAD